jgi:hypothetical protein
MRGVLNQGSISGRCVGELRRRAGSPVPVSTRWTAASRPTAAGSPMPRMRDARSTSTQRGRRSCPPHPRVHRRRHPPPVDSRRPGDCVHSRLRCHACLPGVRARGRSSLDARSCAEHPWHAGHGGFAKRLEISRGCANRECAATEHRRCDGLAGAGTLRLTPDRSTGSAHLLSLAVPRRCSISDIPVPWSRKNGTVYCSAKGR